MAHTLDELRKYRNGRGTNSASSSDSKGRHTLEELRSLDTRRRPQTTQSTQTAITPSEPIRSDRSEGVSSSWQSHTGNATLDSINNMLSMRKVMQSANATPKNMPTLQTNEEVKDYYESLGNHNAIERLFNKEKAEEYNQKQALYPQYHEIKKEEDMKKLAEYGITDDDMRKYASYLDESSRNNFFRGDTRRQVETRRTDQEIQNIKKATGVDLYDYLDEYKGELAKEDANAHPVLSTLNTYAQNPGESLTNVAADVGAYATGKPIKDNYSYTDTVRNEITENIDSGVGRFAYGTVNSIADMGVAMALGTVTGGGTLVSAGTMGLEKASNVMNDAVERGLTPNQIMLEGIASGVTTAATEAIPMGKWEEVAKKGFVGLHGKALAKEITKKFLANALPEGLQEMEEDIADAIMDELIAGDKSEINVTISKLMENGYSREQAEAMAWRDWTKQMVLDGLGGFISGGVMSSGSIAVGLANPYARGEVNREALSEQIKGMDTEGETYKAYRELSEKRGENLENATENEVSDLFLKAYEEASTFDRTEVNEIFKEELKKHDYSEEQANETLEAVLAENKTNYQKSLINNSLVKDALKTAYESDEGLNMRLKTRMNQAALEDTIKTSDQVKTEKKIAKAESKINTAEESSVNGEKVEILGMDIKGGVYVINTDKGTFNADDVNVASSIKDAVAYSVNIKDPAFKETFVTNYRGQDIDTYEAYAYEAFTAGKNFNASILEQGNFIDFLGANALEDFLDAGRMSVSRSTKESEERSIKAAAEAEGKFQKGTFTSNVDYNSLKSTQKKVYNFLKGMANIGGLNINVIYNTETVENGFFQYDSESGGTITVNLAAKARVDEKGIGSTYVIPVLSHELTHYLEKNAESSYMILQKAVFKVLRADGMNIDDEVRSKIEKYKAHNIELTEAEAVHEIIAQACEGMMSNENTMKKTLSYMNEREMKTFKKALDKFFNAVKQFVKSLAGGDEIQNKYADAISRNIDEVQDAWAKAFADALQRQQTLNKEVGLNEEMTADNNTTVVGEDYAQFNIQTYDKSLPFLKDWLKKSGLSAKEQSNILSELESKKDMLESIRKEFPHFDEWSLRDSQEEAIASFGDMSEEEEARMRESVSKYLTAIVNNSEYPYNFDLTTVCKKRQTLNKVLNMLVTDGMFDDFIPDEKTITDLVDTIKANGFEVACALCFVDSKRYRIGSWADSIINGVDAYNQKKKVWVHSYGWNEIVKSMEVKGKVSVNDFNFLNRDIDNEKPNRLASNMTVDELREAGALKLIDKILETESGNTRNRKFANAILKNPSIAHTANVAELLSSEGLDIARIKAPDFHQVVNGASGQATPKLSHDAITYQNDILRKLVEKNVTPEDLYKVGGFRVQSFSDYVANEIFDYIQMVSELAANKFPSHAYTKEYFFVKLFGMTGMKINMSIVPKALADDVNKKFKGWSESRKKKNTEYQYYKAHAGLEKGTNEDGSFDWEDEDGTKWHYIIEDESFGAIRNREKNTYDAKKGFERALEIQSDPRYNKNCGIIWVGVSDAHIRAMMRDKRIPMVIPYHKSSINHLVAEMRAIDAYNDYTDYQIEKYADGTSIEKSDYSKVMGDWDWYADLRKTKDPVQTSKNYIKYCLEHKVRPTFYQFAFEEGFEGDYDHFEEGYYKLLTDFRLYGGNTDGTMDNTFAEQGAVTMTFPEEFESLAKESLAEYESDTTYLDENQKKLYDQAKRIIKQNKKEQKQMSLQEDSEGNKLTEEQLLFFKDSKARDRQGRLLKLYHGSQGGDFDVFKANKFVTEKSGVTKIKGYFGTNPEYSEAYGDVSSYYLNVKNPLDFREFNGKGTLESYKRFLSNKGVKDVKFDSGITQSTILGGKFTDKNGKEYTSYIPYELFDNFEYWNGDGNLTEAILNAGYDSIIWNEGYNKTDISFMPFNENAIKRTDNLNPTSDSRIQYSLQEDSSGKKLTKEQQTYFKNSKVVDNLGRLKVMYHGARGVGFTVFNPDMSDDGISLFFTDSLANAKSYSATSEIYNPDKQMSFEELSNAVEGFWSGDRYVKKEGNDYVLYELGFIGKPDNELIRGSLKEVQNFFIDSLEDLYNENSANYEVYLNITNPLIIDAKGNNWDEIDWEVGGEFSEMKSLLKTINAYEKSGSESKISDKEYAKALERYEYLEDKLNSYGDIETTRGISRYAKENGYDGVIFNNILDYGLYASSSEKKPSQVVIAFDPNQIKSVYNENPTKDPDIRFSLQDESEIPDDEKETYQTLEDDVKLLRDFTKLAKEDMKWQAKDMDALSEYLIKKYDSTISAKDLKEELANLFNAIPEQTDNWLNVMDACFGLASEIYEVSNKKVSVDKNVDADARQAVQAAKRRNAIQQIAIDIYNKYWTMTSYYTDNERAKGLKAQHRQNIKNAVEKQKLADTIYYKALIEKTKRRAEEDRARIKTKTEDKIKAMKESNERKAEIQKIEDQASTFAKWIRQNSKNHPVPDILREPLEMLLTAIDPITREKGTANKKQESLSLSIQKVANALSNINNEMAKTDKPNSENTESGLEMLDIPPYMVAELNEIATKMHELEVNYEVPGSKPLQLMELADLKKLKQDMNAIQKAISTANDLITRANKERVNYVGQKIISYLSKLPQAKRDALNETLTKGVDFLTLDNTTPFYFFKHLGEGGSILFDILADGMDDMTDKVEEISDFTEATYTEEDQKNWRNNIREFELLQKLTDTERANGEKEKKVKVKLTDAQIMSLYCLSKREVEGRHQALEHILRDGIAIGKIDAKKKIARQDTVTITESQLKDIISIVENDEKMKAVADALQHFMSSVCSDWGNKVTMSRWGIKQFTEKFYFPIAVNAELKKTDAADSVGSLFALLNQDFTKPLQDNVRNEIMVYDIFDVFTKHTSDMARYSALGLPILDLIKVWNYSEAENKSSGNKDEDEKYQQRKVSSVKKSIAKAFGERGGNKYISTLIKNLNGKADRGVYDNIGMSLMRKYKASKVAASTMTALVQPLSIFRAAYVMDNKYLLRGLAHRPQIEKCFKNVGVAKWKRMSIGVDTNIGRGVDRIINHQTTFGDKVMDKSLWLAEKMDELTWGYIYNAVEEEIKDTHKDLKPGTKEFDEAVSKRAREVFYSTQIFDSTLTKSAFMRDKGYHATMLSAFMSEPTLSYNMLLDSVTEYYQDAKANGSSHAFKTKGKVVASAISIYVLSAAVESVIREAFTRIRDYDEDDEEFFDGFVMAVVDRLLDELNILNKLPYTKQLMDGLSAFKSGYRNNNKMDEAFISDIANSYKAIKKAVEREEVTYKTIYTTLNALSDVTGLPFANALREVKAVWNNTIGRITGNYLK